MTSVDTRHIFTAADPDPKPAGYAWWKDGPRRATCSCGWRADDNSADTAAASRRWSDEHRAEVAV